MRTTAEQLDHTVMPRGKYSAARGNPKTPSQVAEIDPAYICWAHQEWADKPCSDLLYRECLKDVAESRRQSRVAQEQAED